MSALLDDGKLFSLAILFIIGMFVIFIRMYDLAYNVQTEMARQNATVLSKMLKEFRTLYTSGVVSRVKSQGIEVTSRL